jgi:DNA-binding XRE family transcriptional regulator
VTGRPALAPPLPDQPGGADDAAAVDGPDPQLLRDEVRFRAEVGWRLRKLRTWNDDLSQDELARLAGVTRNFVSAIERGAQGLDAWRLWRIADALGVPLGVLLCQEPLPLTRTRTRWRR